MQEILHLKTFECHTPLKNNGLALNVANRWKNDIAQAQDSP